MTVAFETEVKNVAVGDQVISPLTSKRMLVRSVAVAPFGMLDLTCLDADGEIVTLTLHADETIKVVDA